MYRPAEISNLDTALKLLIPEYEKKNGVVKKRYPDKPYTDSPLIYANFKTRGGTETEINGVYAILDTAEVTTWYREDIKADCRIVRLPDGAVYEVIGEPENVNNRGQFIIFKVERVKGEV
nr:MAG TPA: PORTAL PROTEIN, 15 PROTEIN, HEAD PROTEIN, TAILED BACTERIOPHAGE, SIPHOVIRIDAE.6A [Caudoviricetes sp.]